MRLHFIVALLLVLALVGLAGGADLEDDSAAAELYCSNVFHGVWPDFDHSYHSMCKEGELRR